MQVTERWRLYNILRLIVSIEVSIDNFLLSGT